jgi:hypothetical protein
MDELIKALRYCGNFEDRDGCDEECPYFNDKDCPKRIMHDAADAIEELISRLPKWIDANERLPEQTGEYIVFLKASKKWIDAGEDVSYTTAMWFVKEQKVWKEMNGDDSYNAVLSAVDTDWACSVTHWMPLPEPLNCGARMRGEHDEQIH